MTTYHVTLAEPSGEIIAEFDATQLPRHLFLNHEEREMFGSDDPEPPTFDAIPFDRIGSSVWMEHDGSKTALFVRRYESL
jgi:hypothetical protein